MGESERMKQVRRLAAGDEDALQELLCDYHVSLRALVAGRLDDRVARRVDPDDVLQLAYVAAYKSIPRARFETPAQFYRWLETIVVSQLADVLRSLNRQKRDPRREVAPDAGSDSTSSGAAARLAIFDQTPSRLLARDEAAAAVLSCLARLGDNQRCVIQMRFFQNRPVAEIAAELDTSEAAVHMLCHRGLKAMRKRLVSITRYLTRC